MDRRPSCAWRPEPSILRRQPGAAPNTQHHIASQCKIRRPAHAHRVPGFISQAGGQQLRSHPPGADADGARRARDGDGRSRHRGDISAHPEGIPNALPFELRREFRQVDGEITIRLVVRRNHNTCKHTFGVHADEDFDRTIVASLERLDLRCPETRPSNEGSPLPWVPGAKAL